MNQSQLAAMFILLLLFPIKGMTKRYNDCLKAATDTISMRACLTKDLEHYNAKLNLAYNDLQRKMPSIRGKLMLKNAQSAWFKFRKEECYFTAYPAQPGTIAPLIITSCYIKMTKIRIKTLQSYYDQSETEK
jgi:uncharacterized protein YecT (DUF1311 family)